MDQIRHKPLGQATLVICWLSTLGYAGYLLYVSVGSVRWSVDEAVKQVASSVLKLSQ